jgi:DNA-binding beta-propeller fold protein YncE
MNVRIKTGNILSVFITAMLLIGCGASKDAQKEEIVWPPAPDEPRIKYVKTYESEDDFLSKFGLFTQALAGKTANIRLDRPFDVCTDGQGRVFVTDVSQGIIVFDEVEKEVKAFGSEVPVPLGNPLGIDYGNNKIFVGIAEIEQVVVITPDGKYLNTIGKQGAFPNPVDVAYDHLNKRVVIVDNKKHQVFVYSENGDSLLTIGTRGDGDGEYNYPQSAAIDTAGNIYIVDAFNFRVQVFSPDGKFLRKYGEQGKVFGTFARPKGIALDTYQNVYVVDAVHQNIQIFNNNFDFLMFVGKFANTGNRGFQNPIGIFIDKKNTIFVTDQLNQRVQVFELLKGD